MVTKQRSKSAICVCGTLHRLQEILGGNVSERLWIGLLILVVLVGGRSFAQSGASAAGGPSGAAATDVKNAEIQAVAQSDLSATMRDRALRVVTIEGNYNVGVGVVHRNKTTGPDSTSAIEHNDIAEVYHVISGSGTLVTGGAIEDGKPSKPEIVKIVGPSTSGDQARGGVSREIGPGDVVIIPPNTPHWFSRVNSEMVYLVVRMDPKKVLAAVVEEKK
jgi:mannose-6-phosphate isomerase-like protein (cupin superfamily)